ncbi:MAG: hypothetical protein ACE5ES_01905 [Candidatus Nanoarchaeia archaeon]
MATDSFLDFKKNEQTIEDIDSIIGLLTNVEFEILHVLLVKNMPMNVLNIRNEMLHEKKLKIRNIEIPAYETIDKRLRELERIGFVNFRAGASTKSKYLAVVSPSLVKKYKKRKNELFDEYTNLYLKIKKTNPSEHIEIARADAVGQLIQKYGERIIIFFGLFKIINNQKAFMEKNKSCGS